VLFYVLFVCKCLLPPGDNPIHHHHHHKHPGLGHLARSVSRVTVALSIVSSVSQLFCFLVGCSEMILKGFGFVAFFAGVKADKPIAVNKYIISYVWANIPPEHFARLPEAFCKIKLFIVGFFPEFILHGPAEVVRLCFVLL
jgi:membrane protein YqaA with SNARE-associated domain